MSNLSHKSRERLTKAFTVLTSVTTALSMSGVMYLAPTALAVAPADYGLTEGDVVSAAGSDDPDVYIVNEMGYKRLFLNPAIFNFYGHLGGFAAVKNVSPATRDAFGTSGLFRNCETNDEKVYGVETTGEDTGMLHWVNTPGSQAVIDDANFFKKVFCINSNEFNWYSKGTDYTSVNQVPSYVRGTTPVVTPVTPGAVMVSLSPSNPVAKTITLNTYGEAVMGLRFTGTGKVNELSFKRGGPGRTADYANLYIYEGARRLTGGRTPSSADGTITFISLNVDVAGTKDLSLVADHSGVAGNVNYWELTGVKLDSGTASGFPLMSSNFTFSGANSGTINVDKTGSVANPKVGQKVAHLSEFKVTANTEAAFVKRVQLINGGDMKASDITNLYLEVQGVKVADGKMTTDGYAVFDFGSPGYKIAKGDNRIFKMFGDITGKKSETVKFYLEQVSDVTAIGDQFGFGMKPTVGSTFDDSTNTHSLTLQGGALTITFNGPTATNVGTNTTDTVLARYSMTAISTIEVKKLGLVLCNDTGANDYENSHDTTDGWADLDDIKITDEDTGQVLVGPADGSAFLLNEATGCPNSATGAGKIFTDTFDLVGGKTRNLKVTADVKTANTRAGVALVSTDLIKVVLDGYGESDLSGSSGDVAVLKYAGTNVAVDDSDILPNTDLGANNLTIQSASLTLGLSATPKSTTYVKGTKAVEAAGFTFAASLASDLKVTDITLTGYVADSGTTLVKGVSDVAEDTSLNVANLIAAVKLYDGSTGAVVSETASSNNLNNSTGTIVFNNLNWVVPAGQTKVLLVKTDLSSNATSGSSDVISFDINTTTDVSALDSASSTVNAGNSDPNLGTAPTVIATIADSGTLAISAAPATPISEAKYWGQAGTEFARYRIRANDEAFYIERFNLFNKSDTAAAATNNVKQVKIQYTNEAGSTLTATGPLNNDVRPSVSFGFTGDSRPFVPKDSSIDIIVLVDLKSKAEGATSEVNFSIDFAGGDGTSDGFGDDEFRAVGKGSGTVIDADPASGNTVADLEANNMYVYRVFPKITKETLSVVGEPLGTKDVLKFTIKAEGLSDSKILFNDPESVSLRFEVVASGGADSDMTFNLYVVSTGELIASRTALSAPTDGPSVQNSDISTGLGRASVAFNDWERDFEIAGGTSTTFRVEAAFVNFSQASDYFSLVLRDETSATNPVVRYVDGARSGEDQDISHTAGVFRLLPMVSDTFTKN
ncbi:MAG: hypothetical protein Q8R55_02335 [Candidatus Taylorbacteria bacterium]|nr:hypothetical protein [Candidatus Taylorbacteria bacterium]